MGANPSCSQYTRFVVKPEGVSHVFLTKIMVVQSHHAWWLQRHHHESWTPDKSSTAWCSDAIPSCNGGVNLSMQWCNCIIPWWCNPTMQWCNPIMQWGCNPIIQGCNRQTMVVQFSKCKSCNPILFFLVLLFFLVFWFFVFQPKKRKKIQYASYCISCSAFINTEIWIITVTKQHYQLNCGQFGLQNVQGYVRLLLSKIR